MLRDRYQVLRRLGGGGGGTVYAVRDHLRDHAELALKALWPDADDGLLAQTLRTEFRTLAAVRDPRLGRVFDFGRLPPDSALDGAPAGRIGYFYTRELIAGLDLGVAVAQAGRSVAHVVALAASAARALEVLHRAGLRHGDFKPANAIVAEGDGVAAVRLIDFGLSAPEAGGRAGGTPAYMAPEIIAGGRLDRRADLYALGVTLFELLTGELPSGQRRGGALLDWHAHGVRPEVTALRPEVPARLARVIAELLAPRPDDRVPSALEVAAALERAVPEALGEPDAAVERSPRRAPSPPFVLPVLPRPAIAELEALAQRRPRDPSLPAMVELVGEAGSGRSTALTELGWRLALDGAEVLWAPGGGSRPGVRPGDGGLRAALAQLASLLGHESASGAGADAPATAGPAAAADMLVAAGRRWPVCILLDDFDQADPDSVALARFLAHALPAECPVLLVAARQAASTEELPRVHLSAIGEGEVGVLLAAASGREDSALAARIHRHTGGNLLHVVEVLRTLAGRGFPPESALAELGLPVALDQWARQRLAELDPDERRLCAAVAVLGQGGAPLLAEVLGWDEARARLGCAALHRRGLLERDAAGQWRCARPALARAAEAGLDFEPVRALHAAAAGALEATVGRTHPRVVGHRIAAGDRAGAAEAVVPAVRALRAEAAHAAALELGGAALDLGGLGAAVELELRLELGEAARLVGDAGRVEALLGALASDPRADPRLGDAARLTLGRALDEAGQVERAAALLEQAMGSPEAELRTAAARELSRAHIKRGDYDRALAVVDAALASGADDGDADILVARAFARGMRGDDRAIVALEGAAAAAPPALAATAWNYAALLAFRRGDYRQARAAWERALGAAEQSGDVIRAGTIRMNLGSQAFHVGRYGASLRYHAGAAALLRAAGAETPHVVARKNLGHLLVEVGAYEQARAALAVARRGAERLDLAMQRLGIDALEAIADGRTGEVAEAGARLEAIAAELGGRGDHRRAADTLLDLAELVGGHDEARASAALARVEALPGLTGDHGREARFLALAAELAARMSDQVAARHRLDRLGQLLPRLRAEEAYHLLWSLHASAAAALERLDGAAAAEHRAAALALLERIAGDLPAEHRHGFWRDPRRRALREASAAASPRGGEAARDPDVGGAPSRAAPNRGDAAIEPTALGTSAVEASAAGRLYRLIEIYRRMSSELEPARLLEMVMDAAIELSGADRGFLLLGGAGDQLRTAVVRNLPADMVRAMDQVDRDPGRTDPSGLPYSRTVAERVFRTGEIVFSDQPRADPRFDSARSVHALHLESVVCVPVHARGRLVGALYLESRLRRLSFTDDDLRLLSAFGDQVAILLENARLLAENVERAQALERAHAEIQVLLDERTELLEQRTEELALTRRDLAAVRRRFLGERGAFGLIGRSRAMDAVFELIDRLAQTEVPVLILGESGTGKELVARALHEHGPRRAAPMTAVNCGALPEALLESELFGHERGAFTGADRTRRGLFEAAHGGTLFLDEVGDTPLKMQAQLLRALQERIIRRVGGTADIAVDVRLVAATNRDLRARVAAGSFREDLYYRLHVVPVYVPPLRERAEDIPLLIEHFLTAAAERTGLPAKGISRAALRVLVEHPWPGNVRQLEHAVMNAFILADGAQIGLGDVGSLLAPRQVSTSEPASVARGEDRERARILDALASCDGNRSEAARILQIPRRTFYRRLVKYGIQ